MFSNVAFVLITFKLRFIKLTSMYSNWLSQCSMFGKHSEIINLLWLANRSLLDLIPYKGSYLYYYCRVICWWILWNDRRNKEKPSCSFDGTNIVYVRTGNILEVKYHTSTFFSLTFQKLLWCEIDRRSFKATKALDSHYLMWHEHILWFSIPFYIHILILFNCS